MVRQTHAYFGSFGIWRTAGVYRDPLPRPGERNPHGLAESLDVSRLESLGPLTPLPKIGCFRFADKTRCLALMPSPFFRQVNAHTAGMQARSDLPKCRPPSDTALLLTSEAPYLFGWSYGSGGASRPGGAMVWNGVMGWRKSSLAPGGPGLSIYERALSRRHSSSPPQSAHSNNVGHDTASQECDPGNAP